MCYNHLGPSTKLTSLPGPHFITQEEMRSNTRIFPFKRIEMGVFLIENHSTKLARDK